MVKLIRLAEITNSNASDKTSFWSTLSDLFPLTDDHSAFLQKYENALNQLDDKAWSYIKRSANDRASKRDKFGRYRELFDVLNEALAYSHLKSIGCDEVQFIEAGKQKNTQSPDLLGVKSGITYLCEVKTKHCSDYFELRKQSSMSIRTGHKVNQKVLSLIKQTIEEAYRQLKALDIDNCKRIIFLSLNWDNLHVNRNLKEEYDAQVNQLFLSMNMQDVELLLN